MARETVPKRPQQAANGGVARAWDDLEQTLSEWNDRLEREGLGVISVGPDEQGHGRKDIRSLTATIEAHVTQSVWDLSARVDAFAAAFWGDRFSDRTDKRICRLLAEGVQWHRIARTVRCSKRRISRVSKEAIGR